MRAPPALTGPGVPLLTSHLLSLVQQSSTEGRVRPQALPSRAAEHPLVHMVGQWQWQGGEGGRGEWRREAMHREPRSQRRPLRWQHQVGAARIGLSTT